MSEGMEVVGDREAAFFLAIKTRNETLLRALVEEDAALLTLPSPMGVSPVLFAAYYHRPDMARLLTELGAPLDVFGAAATGNVARLREELNRDPAQARAVSPDGFSPLGLSAFFGHEAAAALLLARGADVNAASRNDMGVTPLHSAVAGGHTALAERLLEAGADVNAAQEGGFTPLMSAVQNGDAALCERLLALGADPLARTEDGRSAASLAREEGQEALAARLEQRPLEQGQSEQGD